MTLLTHRRSGRRVPAALIGAVTVLSLALTGCSAAADADVGPESGGDSTAAAEGGVETEVPEAE